MTCRAISSLLLPSKRALLMQAIYSQPATKRPTRYNDGLVKNQRQQGCGKVLVGWFVVKKFDQYFKMKVICIFRK